MTATSAVFNSLVSGVPGQAKGTVMVSFPCENGCRHIDASYMTPSDDSGDRLVDRLEPIQRIVDSLGADPAVDAYVFVAAALHDLDGNQVASVTGWEVRDGSLVPLTAHNAEVHFANELRRAEVAFDEPTVYRDAWEAAA